ncbi:MAG: NAD(P)H-dependent oxidoreductase [Cyanobacteria bacterium P01_C01_bin.72]
MTSAFTEPNQVSSQLGWRYATKKFDPTKKIPDAVWETLEQSLVLAPSSFGLQPWKFFVIQNPDLRQQLLAHSWGQTPVVNASHLVVFAIKNGIGDADVERHIGKMADAQGIEAEKLAGFSNVVKGFIANFPDAAEINHWSAKQVYIALGFFMTCAAMLKIDTLPMEGFIPAKYDEILHLKEQGYSSVVVCCAGYRAADDKYAGNPKVRFPTEEIVQYVQ